MTSSSKGLTYLTQSPTGIWRFRRRVPAKLRPALGYEWKKSLKTTDKTLAVLMADRLVLESDEAFRRARVELGLEVDEKDLAVMEAYRFAKASLMGIDISSRGAQEGYAMDLMSRAERGKATATEIEEMKIITSQGNYKGPEPTLADMFKVYREEQETKKTRCARSKRLFDQAVDRAEELLKAHLGLERAIRDVTRNDAKAIRASLVAQGKANGTVNKTINIINAAFNCAIRELEIENKTNPFQGLGLSEVKSGEKRRKPMTPGMLQEYLKTADRVLQGEHRDCYRVAVLMAYTGARTAEVAQLVLGDVDLTGNIPFITIRNNALRNVKDSRRERRVPLLGEALEIVRETVEGAKLSGDREDRQEPLFVSLKAPSAPTRVSNRLNRVVIREHMKIDDPRIVAYSTRHSMEDALRACEAPVGVRGAITGHATESAVQSGYGEGESLGVLEGYLRGALRELGLQ